MLKRREYLLDHYNRMHMPEDIEMTSRAEQKTKGPVARSFNGASESGSEEFHEKAEANSPEAKEGRDPPRAKWQTADTFRQYWETRKTFFTDEQHEEAWNETAKILKTYSDEVIDRWNKEIDTLLVYAGLFSAILTAFNVQSYQLLTPPPQTDPVLVALERISAQLSGFSVNPPFVNSTQPTFIYRDPDPPSPPLWAIWLNTLWFSSLIFSLSAASVGIMVKQWLHEYSSGLSGTSRQVARLRQLRLKSLERWYVKEIVSILPVLLQIGSALFFAGLLVLLWHLNHTVAIVGTVLVGVLAVFSLSTIILPSLAIHCAYISPPSRALFEYTRPLRNLLYLFRRKLSSWILGHYAFSLPLFSFEAERFQREHPRMYNTWKLLHLDDSFTASKWRWMEFSLLSRPDTARELDGDMVATAYTTALDTRYLHHAAICTTDLTANATRSCFEAIRHANIAHWGEDGHLVPMWSVHPCMWSAAIISLLTVSDDEAAGSQSSSTLAAALETAYDYLRPYSHHVPSDAPRTRLVCADIASIMRLSDRRGSSRSQMISEALYRDCRLTVMMERASELNLGNDIRQYVASACVRTIRQGLDGDVIDHSGTQRSLDVLRCIIPCVPLPGSPDCKPNDREYQSVRAEAVHALDAFTAFLLTPRALEWLEKAHMVFDTLRERGERACLVSPELVRAMASYQELLQDLVRHDNRAWIQDLKLKLELCNDEQVREAM
ncbi:hypothetical protein L227DRAFT_521624 [Lentinus tigrinus ALCF2SS1-6]|uniref:DUF6535 domain-containing protein n=1 Tax=Lentinus tigrinus ALCF2SS1-6 TaxID=1328759 RepID=A0A5C2SI55_9APHY|nr:hypothetical protein L227DRAFT_521624 [Lentinus tigrinus ALCF2SS1-6]